jgi:hypothetical protein
MATVLSTLFESKGNVMKTEAQSEEASIRVEKTSVAEQHTLRKRNGFLIASITILIVACICIASVSLGLAYARLMIAGILLLAIGIALFWRAAGERWHHLMNLNM